MTATNQPSRKMNENALTGENTGEGKSQGRCRCNATHEEIGLSVDTLCTTPHSPDIDRAELRQKDGHQGLEKQLSAYLFSRDTAAQPCAGRQPPARSLVAHHVTTAINTQTNGYKMVAASLMMVWHCE